MTLPDKNKSKDKTNTSEPKISEIPPLPHQKKKRNQIVLALYENKEAKMVRHLEFQFANKSNPPQPPKPPAPQPPPRPSTIPAPAPQRTEHNAYDPNRAKNPGGR